MTHHPDAARDTLDAAIARRAREVAAAAMGATRGVAPKPSFKTYASDRVMRRLTARARVHRIRRPDPGYLSRTYLCHVNDNVIEACVVVFEPETTRAVGIRLERHRRGWLAVDITIV
jgi:hypothetical protein